MLGGSLFISMASQYYCVYGDANFRSDNNIKKFRSTLLVNAATPQDAIRHIAKTHFNIDSKNIKDKNIVEEKNNVFAYFSADNKYVYAGEKSDVESAWKEEFGPLPKSVIASAPGNQFVIYGNIKYKRDQNQRHMYYEEQLFQGSLTPEQAIEKVLTDMFGWSLNQPPRYQIVGAAYIFKAKNGTYVVAGPEEREVKRAWASHIKPINPIPPGGYRKNVRYRRRGTLESRRYLRDIL